VLPIGSILLAFLVGAIIILFTGGDPLAAYLALITVQGRIAGKPEYTGSRPVEDRSTCVRSLPGAPGDAPLAAHDPVCAWLTAPDAPEMWTVAEVASRLYYSKLHCAAIST
jgi:hypothetical protein